jgi:hypothetical protein
MGKSKGNEARGRGGDGEAQRGVAKLRNALGEGAVGTNWRIQWRRPQLDSPLGSCAAACSP